MTDLTTFENAQTGAEKLRVVEQLVKAKALNRVSKDPRFVEVLGSLAPLFRDPSPREVWSAAAVAGRVAVASPTLAPELKVLLRSNFVTMPGELPDFEDVDNRRYAIAALRLGEPDWRAALLPRVVVLEDFAEKVREEAIVGLLEATPDVASAVDAIAAQLVAFKAGTADVTSTTAKRLLRILKPLRDVWATNPFEPGPRIGLALALLVEQPFRRVGSPKGDLRRKIAILVASLVHQIVRARFSYAPDPKTYEPVDVPRGWFSTGEWREVVDAPEFSDLRTDVGEALRLLVRAGVTDDRLLKVVDTVAGDADRARILRADVAGRILDANPEGIAWLLGRRAVSPSSALANESRLRDVDDILAGLLVRMGTHQTNDATGDNLSSLLAQDLQAAFVARGLVLFGAPGDEIEYAPARHELEGGHRIGIRTVRLLEQGVESVLTAMTPRVVRKALVTPIG